MASRSLTSWLVYRSLIISGAIVLVAAACGISGCSEPTTTSPFSGKQATGSEIKLEADAERRKAADADARVQAESQATVASAQRKAKLALARLSAAQQSESAQIQADLEDAVGSASVAASLSAQSFASAAADVDARAQAAQEQIEKNRAAALALWNIARPFTALIPGAGGVVQDTGDKLMALWSGVATIGAGAAVLRARSNGKDADAAKADAAKATTIADEHETASRSIVNALDVIRAKVPEVAAAMKTHKADMLGQLTDLAVKLIKDESIT